MVTTPIFTPNTPVCFRDGILFRLNSLLVNFTESFTSTLEREKLSAPSSRLCWAAPGPQRAGSRRELWGEGPMPRPRWATLACLTHQVKKE